MRNALRGGGLAAAAALVLSAFAVQPANADPSFTPDSDDVVGVGSDTTEFVMQGLADGYNTAGVGGTVRLASFNATGSATITPRSGASAITRPNGSSAGINELQANPDVSFARSSRGPAATGDEDTLFFPFAKDTLGYVYAAPTSKAKANLTLKNVKQIYTCVKTDWSDFKGGKKGHIQAKAPQAGSGTRSFFLASIGITEEQLQDAIAQPNKQCSVSEVQEHDPVAVIGQKNAIAPFSLARYSILKKAVKRQVTFAEKGFQVQRNVYNVIRTDDVDTLGPLFDDGSWICTTKAAKDIITAQGFKRLPAGECGIPIVA